MDRSNLVSRHHGRVVTSYSVAGLKCTEAAYPPDLKVARHSHHLACFALVLSGVYTECYTRRTLECRPSCLKFRPAEEAHSNHYGRPPVCCFFIDLEPSWLARMRTHAVSFDEPIIFDRSPIVWLAMRLRQEARQIDRATPLAVEGLMLEIIAEASRSSTGILERGHPRWLKQAKEILHDRFSESLSLSEIAEAVGVHPVHLAAAFRQHYCSSVGEYIRRLRIEFACRQISTTDAPLVGIALEAGFSHQAHFSRIFKRLTGLTPAQYRKTIRLS